MTTKSEKPSLKSVHENGDGDGEDRKFGSEKEKKGEELISGLDITHPTTRNPTTIYSERDYADLSQAESLNDYTELGEGAGDEDAPVTPEERKLIRKIDLRLLPYLAPLYLLFNLDRHNIAYARLYGIEEDLNLTSEQYALALSVIHIGYVLFEVPSNLLIKYISPPIWIGIIIITCGVATLCMALAKDFASIMVIRFFLGMFEAGFFPGVIYLLGMWYTRKEQGFRIALVSSASTFSGAIAGPLAYGISQMDGLGGLVSWQWIFIVEGAPTVLLGIFARWIIPGKPEETKWLNPREKKVLTNRLTKAHVELQGKKVDTKQLISALKDFKTYTYIVMYLGFYIPTSSISQLMPTIIKEMGFSTHQTMLMTMPPYLFALMFKMALAWNSDRTLQRSFHICGALAVSMVGFILQAATTDTVPRYIGVNLAFSGAVASLPICLSWSNNNMIGSTKAPTVIALIIMMGSLGGIVGSHFYRDSEAPQYIQSNLMNIGFLCLAFATSLGLRYKLILENKKLAQRDEALARTHPADDDHSSALSLDMARGFRYVL